jgi:protein AATF/BFR2
MIRSEASVHATSVLVRKQADIFGKVLELRINLQKSLEIASRLPVNDRDGAYNELLEDDSALSGLVSSSCKESRSLLDPLIDMLEVQVDSAEGSSSSSSSGSRKRDRSSEDSWTRIEHAMEQSRPRWKSVLEKWNARLHFGTETNKSKMKVFNSSLWSRIDEAMADEDRVLEKSRMKRGNSKRFGVLPDDLDDDDDDDLNSSGTGTGTGTGTVSTAVLSEVDSEVYDDRTFYAVLLKSFITSSSASSTSDYMRKEDIEMLRKYRAAGSEVDRKATKGRRLRYHVHTKLQNFMFPMSQPTPQVDVDRLFNSLFAH